MSRDDRHLRVIEPGQPEASHLLDDTRAFCRRFVKFPDEHALGAVTLWAIHTHMVHHFHTTPRLAVLSPEASSGKTRVLDILELLVPEPLLTINASPAAVFRTLDQRQATLLFDEVDAIWNKRGQDDRHEDLRALLNAGYRNGARIPRCVGPRHEVVLFNVFAAAALAGLGELPDTIMSRSIIIRMRRRAPTEHIEPFRSRVHEPVGHELRDRISAWADDVGEAAGKAWPKLPPGIVDRPAECWEPLIAVADLAGGHWPQTSRGACEALCQVAQDRRVSLGVRLLGDLRIVFGDALALHAETLVERLTKPEEYGLDPDAPWPELSGKPLSKRRLADILRRYDVRPTKVKVEGESLQGYRYEDLWDAWQRYLPAETEPPEPRTDSEREQPRQVPEVPEVPDFAIPERACPSCDGEGCDECGEFKSADGTEL